MLIMSFLVLSIDIVQYVMDMLEDVFNVINEVIFLVSFGLDMSQIFLSNYKCYGHINGTWWLESQAQLKRVAANQTTKSLVKAVMDIGEALITCVWML